MRVVINSVIVTIIADSISFDMELSANEPINKLIPFINKALSNKGKNVVDRYMLVCRGRVLPYQSTLFNEKVWDGSIITISYSC